MFKKTFFLLTVMFLITAGCSKSTVSTVADVGGCPDGVTISASGNIYITDICDGTVIKIAPDGEKTVIVDPGEINAPDGITVVTDEEGKDALYVTETGTDPNTGELISSNGTIKKVDVDTGAVTEFVGSTVLSNPTGIATDKAGNIYVADQAGFVYKIEVENGIPKAPVDLTATLPAGVTVEEPHGLTLVNNPDDSVTLYVTDQSQAKNNIIKIDVDTDSNVEVTELTPPTVSSDEQDKFNKPHGISTDKKGAIFVADENNNRIQIITPGGNVVTFAGSGQSGDSDGSPQEAKFGHLRGIAVDDAGDVLVCDYQNGKVKKVTQ